LDFAVSSRIFSRSSLGLKQTQALKADKNVNRKQYANAANLDLISIYAYSLIFADLHFGHPAAFSEKNTPR